MDRNNEQTSIHTNKYRRSIPVHRDLHGTWTEQSDDYPENDRSKKYNRHNKYISAIGVVVLSVLFPSSSLAETVGGVSATANPVANSSGSVTNQAIQVLQGPYITNTYGGGIQCQGPTLNITPYVTGAVSAAKPFEGYYNDPVYDVTDNFGAFDDEGKEIGDGILDNPGDVLFHKRTRTGQKDNYNLSLGFSMTWSNPLDKTLQDQCKQAAAANIDLMTQAAANKRLDFEIARLKNCGELKKQGIYFHPKSPYYKVCADVVVTNPGGIIPPHAHSIPSPSKSERPYSSNAADLGAPLTTQP